MNFTVKKIDNTFVVWLEKQNQYIQLAEPAFFVFNRYFKENITIDNIIQDCSQKYNISTEKSQQFVNEIISSIEKLNIENNNDINKQIELPNSEYLFNSYSEKAYTIGTKKLLFKYESNLYEHYLHPLLAHLQTDNNNKSAYIYELFNYKNQTFIRHNGTLLGNWNEQDSQLIKGAAFIQILNDMYNKQTADWMATLHASALSNDHKTIAFSAASGSGKSTIAALLRAQGYSLISDDFVAVDRDTKCAHPFPLAISIKDGAVDMLSNFFPSLNDQESQLLSGNRSGRYLSSEKEIGISLTPKPIHELIFVEYSPAVDFEFSPMNKLTAMQLLIDESWIPASSNNVENFLNWVSEVSFYKLRYSNNNMAINKINELFNF